MFKFRLLFFISLCYPLLVIATEKLQRDPFYSAPMPTVQTQRDNRQTAWIPLYYVKADKVISLVTNKQAGLLSPCGVAHAEPQTNQLWIKDDILHIRQIKTLIQHLDQRSPQFLIKARIITIDKRYEESLGIEFNDNNQTTDNNTEPANAVNTVDKPNTFSFNLAKLASNHLINLKLSALEQNGHANLIAKPTLITLNKKMASIESGAEVPYEEATSSGATSVSFKKAVLKLSVTPQLLPNRQILLHLALNQDKVSALTVKGVPAIETQQMTTQVIAQNNQMVILGGILEENHAIQTQGIPILSHTPIIGSLFQHQHHQNGAQVLLICITTKLLT